MGQTLSEPVVDKVCNHFLSAMLLSLAVRLRGMADPRSTSSARAVPTNFRKGLNSHSMRGSLLYYVLPLIGGYINDCQRFLAFKAGEIADIFGLLELRQRWR